ncbi:protein-L-isoaspartate O-methyltransferase family protein, partial [Escherichia coli]|uniref:protein-L-isoaspartate O-methyltransferase family protein n=1 Tax=Escherichia coli TaxID=562 RepID=UPI003AF3BF54
ALQGRGRDPGVAVGRRDAGAEPARVVAPFDAIVVAAAGLTIPQALLSQLAPGGRLIAPEGGSNQRLVLIERTGAASWKRTELEAVRFVPLRAGIQS